MRLDGAAGASAGSGMSIATKTGDNGTTALMFGRRVAKTDPRVAAYGTCDELNAALGMVRAFCGDSLVTDAVTPRLLISAVNALLTEPAA
jgi:cob(I)alamin adenosyltransferase